MVAGGIDIEVNTSNERITRVDFYIDMVYKATDSTLPYSWRWDQKGSGKKVITAIAYDDVGTEYFARLLVEKLF
jgi:hypothetical protein